MNRQNGKKYLENDKPWIKSQKRKEIAQLFNVVSSQQSKTLLFPNKMSNAIKKEQMLVVK